MSRSLPPDDEALRRKAYEFWEAGGRVDGRDKGDWFRAVHALSGLNDADLQEPHGAVRSVPHAIGDVIAGGFDAMTAIATGAVSAIGEIFAHRDTPEKEK